MTTSSTQAPSAPGLVSAQTGLRGGLIIWVVIFHAFLYSTGWNLQGAALMPIFFLLAGYSLAFVYGERQQVSPEKGNDSSGRAGKNLDVLKFYRSRFARIGPIYYITLFMAIPTIFLGHNWINPEDFWPVLVTNLLAIHMWFGAAPQSIVSPSWTISTLVFFYLVFPVLLAWHEKQNDQALSRWLVILFVVQLILLFVVLLGVLSIGTDFDAFFAATAWPISRLPVFDMGIVAGLLLARQSRQTFDQRISFAGFPANQPQEWGGMIDRRAALLLLLVSSAAAADVAGIDTKGYVWLQAVLPYLMIQVIVGLSLINPQSNCLANSVLNWRFFIFFGEISLSLYLVHEVVVYYLNWLTHPDVPITFAPGLIPVWSIPMLFVISVGLAILLERFIERPGRALLKAK